MVCVDELLLRKQRRDLSIASAKKAIVVDDSLPPYTGDDADTFVMEPTEIESAAARLREELEVPLDEPAGPKVPCKDPFSLQFSNFLETAGCHTDTAARSFAECSSP